MRMFLYRDKCYTIVVKAKTRELAETQLETHLRESMSNQPAKAIKASIDEIEAMAELNQITPTLFETDYEGGDQ